MISARRVTRAVHAGQVQIGSDAPISVQAMTKVRTGDIAALVRQVGSLVRAGAEIVRLSILDSSDLPAISALKKRFDVPLVADIHYDYRLALAALDTGVDKLRVNPGNIRRPKLREVLSEAARRKIPVRLGFNSGSLPEKKDGTLMPIVDFASDIVRFCEDCGFFDLVISLKTPSVGATLGAYRAFAVKCQYPFHLGVTEAGSGLKGITKSVLGIGILLEEGIGDTIRVSLTGSPEEEVRVAKEILQVLGLRTFGPDIISCPTCGRCEVPLIKIALRMEKKILTEAKKIPAIRRMKIALMGCGVNGPGEAKQADIGIAGGRQKFALFKKGKIIGTYPEDEIEQRFFEHLQEMVHGESRIRKK
jgi:(E)-4-hydroxy-3-methylbut-2-enyl-diphosphate synthase